MNKLVLDYDLAITRGCKEKVPGTHYYPSFLHSNLLAPSNKPSSVYIPFGVQPLASAVPSPQPPSHRLPVFLIHHYATLQTECTPSLPQSFILSLLSIFFARGKLHKCAIQLSATLRKLTGYFKFTLIFKS